MTENKKESAKKRDNKVGALPSEYAEWQTGRNAATLRFVRDTQFFLQDSSYLHLEDRMILEDAIEQIRKGDLNFSTWITPEEYLKLYKDV
jgi:hypothetical protein